MPIKRIEIRWRDLDGFGHVNNSTYLTYLEEARDQHLTDVLGEAVRRTVIRRLEIDFISETLFDSERQFERRAFHMVQEDMKVVRIDQRVLG